MMVKNINPGTGSGFVNGDVFVNAGKFYFTGFTTANGREPWVSDGTSAGTILLRDVTPGSESSPDILFKIALGNDVYFAKGWRVLKHRLSLFLS